MRKISLLAIPFIMYTGGLYASSRNNGNNRHSQTRGTRSYTRRARNYNTQHAVVSNNPSAVYVSRYSGIDAILFTLEYHEEMLPNDFPSSTFMSYEHFSFDRPVFLGGRQTFGTMLNDNIISAISNNDSQFMSPIIVNIDRSNSRRPMLNVLMRMDSRIIITGENRRAIRGIANYFDRYNRHDVIERYSEYFRMGEEEHNNTVTITNPNNEHTEEEEEISPLFRLIMSIGGSNSWSCDKIILFISTINLLFKRNKIYKEKMQYSLE